MNSYENEIMELLQGKTPKEKYEFLQELLKKANLFVSVCHCNNGF